MSCIIILLVYNNYLYIRIVTREALARVPVRSRDQTLGLILFLDWDHVLCIRIKIVLCLSGHGSSQP